jgi:hypothetical protein
MSNNKDKNRPYQEVLAKVKQGMRGTTEPRLAEPIPVEGDQVGTAAVEAAGETS